MWPAEIHVVIAELFERKFNRSQQRAIHSALKKGNGFVLVKGPPGTGNEDSYDDII